MKPSREEVLMVAKECGFEIKEYGEDQWIEQSDDLYPLERFAAAMYEAGVAKGAEDMRERAAVKCENDTFGSPVCASGIRALPITPANTEGDQDV